MPFFLILAITSVVFSIFVIIFFIITVISIIKGDNTTGTILSSIASILSAGITIITSLNIDVPKPIILPLNNESQIYIEDTEITITSDEPDFLTIYYTTNGHDPKDGKVYESGITISESTTICARNKFLFWWSEISKSGYNLENKTVVGDKRYKGIELSVYIQTMSAKDSTDFVMIDSSVFDNITFDGTIDDKFFNGTMPKGTASEHISITEEMKEILASIQKISIGTSKEWIDNKLGSPYASTVVKVTNNGRVQFDTDGESSEENELLECVYMFDIVSVIAYYDITENSCKAFFVTLMKDVSGIDIIMPEAYSFITSNKPLGEFAFTDIYGDPINAYGYASNGSARSFYGEQSYYMGGGNYQEFYFAILDYGMLNSRGDFYDFMYESQFDILPMNNKDNYRPSDLLIQQRSKLYPNTYGISALNYNLTFDLFGSYLGFDSVSFRKNN